MGLHALLLHLLGLVHLLIVVLHHLLVRLGIDWRLPQGLLSSPLLNLHDGLRLVVLPHVVPDRLLRLQLLAGPPDRRLFVKDLEALGLEDLELDLLFEHEETRLPLRQVNVGWVGLHDCVSEALDSRYDILLLNWLCLDLKDLPRLGDGLKHPLAVLLGQHDAVTLVMLVLDKAVWGLHNGFSTILSHFFGKVGELVLVLFVVLPRDSLQLGRLEHSLVGQLFDAPDEPIEIDPDVVD